MTMFQSRILRNAMALFVLLMLCAGCVKRMSATNETAQAGASAFATLRSVTVAADGSSVELTSDRPFTYTSYKGGEPAKIVLDVSQTEPGAIPSLIEVNRGSIRRIEVEREPIGSSVVTRLSIVLVRDVDFSVATDPSNKSKLTVSLALPEPEVKAEEPQAKEAPLVETRIEENTLVPAAAPVPVPLPPEPAAKAAVQAPAPLPKVVAAAATVPAGRGLNAILATADGIEFSVQGGVETFNSFKLSQPDRIVVDMFKVKNSLAQNVVPVGAFGVTSARVGTTPDKVRVVLDAAGAPLPAYEVVKSDLAFGKRCAGA